MDHALQVLGLLASFVVFGWGVIKYIQARMDAQAATTKADVDALHSRINDVRNEYVHQDHLDQMLGAIKEQVGNVREEQRRTNERIDKLLSHLIENK